jgi:predicted Zn-dependent protease
VRGLSAPSCEVVHDIAPPLSERYLSEADTQALFERIVRLAKGGGDTTISVTSQWLGNLRWAQNRVTTGGDTRTHEVTIFRSIRGASGICATNKLDDSSLTLALETAERIAQYHYENPDAWYPSGAQEYLQPQLWSDDTSQIDARQRSSITEQLVQTVRQDDLRASGYLAIGITARSVRNTTGLSAYYTATQAEYSVTVRNSEGTGSGWAGSKHYDWNAIDPSALTTIARNKCLQSVNPKTIEPGRYTAILEPQAVYELMNAAVSFLYREPAERDDIVYTLSPGQSKIGQKILDSRITISTSPLDRHGEYIPFDEMGYPYRPVTWIENGVLKELSYTYRYAVEELGSAQSLPNPRAFHVHGEATSIAEMIATTSRGLLVTRLSGTRVLDKKTLLMTGYTRDGVWLIEKGEMKYPVRNFRFQESPMFVFNRVMQIGPEVPVFATPPALVPAMKVDDFHFASLADAI